MPSALLRGCDRPVTSWCPRKALLAKHWWNSFEKPFKCPSRLFRHQKFCKHGQNQLPFQIVEESGYCSNTTCQFWERLNFRFLYPWSGMHVRLQRHMPNSSPRNRHLITSHPHRAFLNFSKRTTSSVPPPPSTRFASAATSGSSCTGSMASTFNQQKWGPWTNGK